MGGGSGGFSFVKAEVFVLVYNCGITPLSLCLSPSKDSGAVGWGFLLFYTTCHYVSFCIIFWY